MDEATLAQTLDDLRRAQAEVLAPMPVAEVVGALDQAAVRLGPILSAESDRSPRRHSARRPYLPAAEALLRSLRRPAIEALLREEFGNPAALDRFVPRAGGGRVRAVGPALSAHFLAGNTPLLSWPSFAAALLVKSAIFAKLSRADGHWPRVFAEALAAAHPGLGRCIALSEWPGGTRALDALLCSRADAVLAYGSDAALAALRELTPVGTPFLGYGHRVSLGLVLRGADPGPAAEGFARDALLYDQEGCLSLAMLFVEGTAEEAASFAECLAGALDRQANAWALPPREPAGAAAVRAARHTALFAEGARVWGDDALRWTLLLEPGRPVQPACGACVVPIHPLPALEDLPTLLAPLFRHLQGAALAAPAGRAPEAAEALARAGVSRICPPGDLQAPPFTWHHDGRQVLAPLIRWVDHEAGIADCRLQIADRPAPVCCSPPHPSNPSDPSERHNQ